MRDPKSLLKDLVLRYAQQSKCRSRQVGAILMDEFGHVFGQGFNSAPLGSDCNKCPRCDQKSASGLNLDQALCAHAEANAISAAARGGRATNGSTLACTTKPCAECAKAIVGAGIKKVYYIDDYPSVLTDFIFSNAQIELEKL